MHDRTVSLPTRDHGTVVLPEPSWCAGHADHHPTAFRADITHAGPEHHLTHHGEPVFTLVLTQHPYATMTAARSIGLYVGVETFEGRTFTPAGVDALADSLAVHIDQLRAHARALAALLAGGAR
ncbi:hypothetical protein [Streptomyces sp. NPDC048663]|uniref:DUF6907 domain-containing protein n=1 Tax=Streptomyces sp. NPDC048663 TaxID=3155638 RepID=UPI003421E2DA